MVIVLFALNFVRNTRGSYSYPCVFCLAKPKGNSIGCTTNFRFCGKIAHPHLLSRRVGKPLPSAASPIGARGERWQNCGKMEICHTPSSLNQLLDLGLQIFYKTGHIKQRICGLIAGNHFVFQRSQFAWIAR